jgi:uncharacterized damage-inducible protein DinB
MAENVSMEIEQRYVEPLAGFSKEIGYYLTSFQFGRDQTKELLEDLTPEEIAKRYLPEMHSIGALVAHLGECEYWYFQAIARDRELTEEEIKFCHFCDTTENDVDRGYTAEYLIQTLHAISAKTREFLAGLTDEDLDKFHRRPDVDPPRDLSLRWLLQLSIDHEGHHRGQISMLKRLIRGGKMAS